MRSALSFFYAFSTAITALFIAFRRQKLLSLLFLGFLLLFLAAVFSFLAFTPVLSPFIYPLF